MTKKQTPQKTQDTKHHVGNAYYHADYENQEPSGGGGGKTMPPAVLYKIARKSTSGGTFYCHYCGLRFAAYAGKLCKIGAFGQDHVCMWCRKEHPEARPILR